MDRRTFIIAIGGTVFHAAPSADAQTGGKVWKIGFLGVSRAVDASIGLSQAFVTALRDLGWIEGRNIVYEYRWSEQQNDRLPALAAELVESNVDLIVITSGATGTKAAKDASATIPIVMTIVADPVKFGLIASFANPGGNVTGLAQPLVDWGKWLELAQEGVRGATRIAVMANSTNIVYADYVAQNEDAARRLDLQLQMLPVTRAEDFAAAFAAMKRERAMGLVVGPDALFISNMQMIIELAQANHLPIIAANRRYAELGALLSYGTDVKYMYRRAATYADKILKGTKPAALPVEQPAKFELVINLKTAKALGLTIPQSLLLRADEVIQ
jgi:putative ABC transport system substrate-binding protein